MAADASSAHAFSLLVEVDYLYFSALHEEEIFFQIYDEKFAEELQLQDVIASSLSSTSTIMAATKPSKTASTRKMQKGEPSRSGSRSRPKTLCIICTDTKSAAKMFTSRACSHSFCADCVSKHIAAKLEDNIAVKCPEPKCEVALEPEMCESFVPKEVLERWGDALFSAMLVKMKRVHCPFEDCSEVMIAENEGSEEAVVTAAECPSCRRMFCAQCKVGWHGEMECGEFQRLRKKEGGGDRDDVMTMKLADRKKWKRCPYCKIYVEKIEGCLHITCRCGSEFCYNCGSKWDGNHACPPSAYERTVYGPNAL